MEKFWRLLDVLDPLHGFEESVAELEALLQSTPPL